MRALPLLILFYSLTASAIMTDPFQITMVGWQTQQLLSRKGPQDLKEHEVLKTYKSPRFLQDGFEISISLQKNPAQSEWVMMIPGSFGPYDSAECNRLGVELFRKGYSIVRFPNPLSRSVAAAGPLYKGMDFHAEGQLYSDIIHQMQKEYGFKKFHFFGSSYGAFSSAVTAVLYGPEFTGRLLLLSPPKNMTSSLIIMDSYFDEMKDSLSVWPFSNLKTMILVGWSMFHGKAYPVTPEQSKSFLVVTGFHKNFRDLTLILKDRHDKSVIPFYLYRNFSSRFREEQLKMRFIPFLKENYADFFAHPEHNDLMYWLNQLPGRWDVYTSTDDFINETGAWLKSPHIHISENGGHVFGIMEDPQHIAEMANFLPKL